MNMALISDNPIIIDESGYSWSVLEQRQRVLEWTVNNQATGREAGGTLDQFFGNLVEHLISMELTGQPIWNKEGDDGWDYMNPNDVKFDVKARGGDQAWQDQYGANDGLQHREGKHNLYARQLNNPNLNAEAYIFCHLHRHNIGYWNRKQRALVLSTSNNALKPMRLWVRGWISRQRCHDEQVFTPQGSISERGNVGWMEYRDNNIEIYDHNLVRIDQLTGLRDITNQMVIDDATSSGTHLNLSTIDACRIAYDLCERGVLSVEQRDQALASIDGEDFSRERVAPFLSANQYHAFMRYTTNQGITEDSGLNQLGRAFDEVDYVSRY